jgi:hypothetical protein
MTRRSVRVLALIAYFALPVLGVVMLGGWADLLMAGTPGHPDASEVGLVLLLVSWLLSALVLLREMTAHDRRRGARHRKSVLAMVVLHAFLALAWITLISDMQLAGSVSWMGPLIALSLGIWWLLGVGVIGLIWLWPDLRRKPVSRPG